MPRVGVYLLGPPRIEVDGAPITFDTRKAMALVAYLGVMRERCSREALVAILWPDYGRTNGHAALRRTLSTLRKPLGDRLLITGRDTVALAAGPEMWIDAARFRELLSQCDSHLHGEQAAAPAPADPGSICPACLRALEAAAELYRDDFLAGFTLKDSLAFDDWQLLHAESYRQDLCAVLWRLSRGHMARGDFHRAIEHTRRILALEPADEAAHCLLMQLLGWTGQRSAALRQYATCVRLLEEEWRASPLEATTAIYRSIQEGRLPPAPVPEAASAEGSAPTTARGARTTSAAMTSLLMPRRKVTAVFVRENKSGHPGCLAMLVEDAATGSDCRIQRKRQGLALFFGEQGAREADPELALRVALEIRRKAAGSGVTVFAGVATSWEAEEPERGAATNPLNAAMLLCEAAGPGTILVSERTYRLTRGAFVFRRFRGRTGTGASYQVGRLRPEPHKTRGFGETRIGLVGREAESRLLNEAYRNTQQSQLHVVTIVGEAGVGKSRLVEELRSSVSCRSQSDAPVVWLEGRCLVPGLSAGYSPFTDLLRELLGFEACDGDEARRRKLRARLAALAGERKHLNPGHRSELERDLGSLLSIPPRQGAASAAVTAEQAKHRTFVALAAVFAALAGQAPLVLVLEDLHWADDLSLDLIGFLLEKLRNLPVLLLCTYRPEREHRSAHLAAVASQKCPEGFTEISLRELNPTQSARLLDMLVPAGHLGPEARSRMLEKAQGNPFFLEELVRAATARSGYRGRTPEWPAIDLPETLEDVILGRVDRLEGEQRMALECASVIGRVFPKQLLLRAASLADASGSLNALEDLELVYKERSVPQEEYSFRHVLMQEAVYAALSEARRRDLHGSVARALESLHPGNHDEQIEVLALHYDRSGDVPKAVHYRLASGEKARRASAYEAAIAHFHRGLELLEALPDGRERRRKELALRLGLGVPLILVRGHAAPEVEASYNRARDLCELDGEPRDLFEVLLGLRRLWFGRGQCRRAHEIGQRMLKVAEDLHDTLLISRAHMMLAETALERGLFRATLEHCRQGMARYDAAHAQQHIMQFGNDTGVGCLAYKALAEWHLGYPQRAASTAGAAVGRARLLNNPFTMVFALEFSAMVSQARREAEAVAVQSEEVLRISTEQGFTLYITLGSVTLGWASVLQGRQLRPLQDMRGALDSDPRLRAFRTLLDAMLTEACAALGQTAEALETAQEGLARIRGSDAHAWEPELSRLRGDALLALGEPELEVERCYARAFRVAEERESLSLELRAAMSMCGLRTRQGRAAEGREALAAVYARFAEGFDTPDLRAARRLLGRR